MMTMNSIRIRFLIARFLTWILIAAVVFELISFFSVGASSFR